jgi:hypothetical protein
MTLGMAGRGGVVGGAERLGGTEAFGGAARCVLKNLSTARETATCKGSPAGKLGSRDAEFAAVPAPQAQETGAALDPDCTDPATAGETASRVTGRTS